MDEEQRVRQCSSDKPCLHLGLTKSRDATAEEHLESYLVLDSFPGYV